MFSRLRRGVLLAGVVSLAVLPWWSAGGQVVAGRLVDRATRGVVEGAAIQLADTANVVIARAVSDTSGEFFLDLPRPGKYRLYFTADSVALGASEAFEVGPDDFFQRIYVLDVYRNTPVYFEFQVAKPVAPQAGNPAPRYPEELRAQNVEGMVHVQFVVDESGRPMQGTLRVLRSTDPAFTREVQAVIWRMRFLAAELKGGRRVRQLVQMPFEFRLTRR